MEMSASEVGAILVALFINAALILQGAHILFAQSSKGLNKWSWLTFALALLYLFIFSLLEQQHWIIIVNYGVSTFLHSAICYLVVKYD